MQNFLQLNYLQKVCFLFLFFGQSAFLFGQGSCATAVPVTNLTGTSCATATPSGTNTVTPPTGCVTGTNDTWFSFVAQGGSAGISVTNSTNNWNPEYVVATSSNNTCAGTLNVVQCEDSTGNYTNISSIVNGLVVGQTYWIVVSSNGNLSTGTISVCVNNPPQNLNCVNNDACSIATIITLAAPGAGNACVSDCNNGADPGLDFVGNVCEDMPNPTVWYQFTTGANTANINVNLTSATFSNPEFSIFVGNSCGLGGTWTLLNCVEGLNGSATATNQPVSANTTYVIAVSDASGDQGNFSLCITQNLDNSSCNTNDLLRVTATSLGSPFTGPFQPGELVTFCYTVTDYQQINCNYVGAFIPTFGDCWDPSSFNAQGMPNIINTPLNVNGVIQPCAAGPPCAWAACVGTPTGSWVWFPAGSATYNVAGFYPAGTPMPGGWYLMSSYSPQTNACTGDPTDPDNTYGDGSFPSCGSNTFDYNLCFTLRAGPSSNCNVGATDCSVSIRTFADGEFGAWANIGCTGDQPFLLPNNLRCCVAATQTSSISNVACNGANSGSVDLNVIGGQTPYAYQWSNGRTTQDLSGLANGTYNVTITEAFGCVTTATFTVNQPTAITRSTTVSNVSCNGLPNGAVNLTVSGGTGTYTYLWNNGSTTEDLTGIVSGNYTVTITDGNGCTTLTSASVSQPSVLSSSVVSVTNSTCLVPGAVNISVSGGTAAYTFAWSNGRTTEDITGLSGGSYTVTITDANGCSTTNGPNVVNAVGVPTLAVANSANILCSGGTNGFININTSGGVPNFTYLWSNGRTTEDISGLTAGTYILTLTDANNCTSTVSSVLTQPAVLSTSTSQVNLLCNNINNGSLDLTVNGGSASYAYQWSNAAQTEDLTGLAAGTYTVTVTDANSCTTITSATLSQPTLLTSSVVTVTNSTCLTPGTVNISVNGGTSPYSFNWNNGATTEDLSGLSAASYIVTITDNNGCSLTNGPNVVNAIGQPTINVNAVNNVSCNGSNNGSINITLANGVQPYSFVWSNGLNTEDISNLTSGTYSVTVTDANGCTISSVATITQPSLLSTSSTVTDAGCNSVNSGSVDLTISGGTSGYSYLWSNGSSTQDIFSVFAGTYQVTITDANLCTTVTSATVSQPTLLNASAVSSPVSCNAGTNGSVNLTNGGGTGPYTYNWNNGSTTEDINGLVSGSYIVTITDANGCITLTGASVSEPTVLNSALVSNVPANCSNGGSLNISVSGGTTGYTYLWNNSANTEDLSGLSAGDYTVTITDANGCTISNGPNTITVIGPQTLTLNTDTDVSCNGGNNGAIDISVNGGTTPYSFLWSNNAVSEDVNGLTAGNYSVTVTDNFGCVVLITNINISEPSQLTVSGTTTNVNCNGSSNGAVNITVVGGVGPYSFQWSNNSNNEDINSITAGSYLVTITDANGCILSATPFTISEPTAITLTNTVQNSTCGNNNGALNITVSGGTPGYTYQWSNGSTTEDISGIAAGDYDLIINDLNGCSIVRNNLNVANSSNLSITVNSDNEDCGIANSGNLSIIVNGGLSPLNYQWNNGSTAQNVNNIGSGSYSVTVTDADGCTATGSASVSTPFQPTLNAGVLPTLANDTTAIWGTNIILSGGNDQTASGVAYNWISNGPSNANFTGTVSHQTSVNPDTDGSYIFIITASSTDGCVAVDTILVTIEANNQQIPTAFSPNGDNSNDVFQVVDLDKSLLVEFKVYNRWGQLIFNDEKVGFWDGKYNGAEQTRDLYMYVISWKSSRDNTIEIKRGHVTLLR